MLLRGSAQMNLTEKEYGNKTKNMSAARTQRDGWMPPALHPPRIVHTTRPTRDVGGRMVCMCVCTVVW